jgi:hypothetical protein
LPATRLKLGQKLTNFLVRGQPPDSSTFREKNVYIHTYHIPVPYFITNQL